jgi:hypothetical protein
MAQRSATLTHQSRLPSAGDKQAHYLLVVKASQPALLARCAALPWYAVPELDRTCDRDHGRIELRTLRSYRSLAGAAPSPTTPARHDRDHLRHHQPHQPPDKPARLADLIHGHWAIDNRLHDVRDTTFARTPPRCAPAAAPASWRPGATWSSACCARQGQSTSPPPYATTPATHADPSPPSGSDPNEAKHSEADAQVLELAGAGSSGCVREAQDVLTGPKGP